MQPSSDLIAAFLKDRDEPCPKCHYNLRNAAGVCPECGAVPRLVVERPGLGRIGYRLAGILLVGRLVVSAWEAITEVWLFTHSLWYHIVQVAWITISAIWCIAWLTAAWRRRGPKGNAGRTLVIGAVGLAALELAKYVISQAGFLYFRR